MVTASDRDGVIFSLSAGNRGDGPEGRTLLQQLGPADHPVYLLMDRAYEGDETRALAVERRTEMSPSVHLYWIKYNS